MAIIAAMSELAAIQSIGAVLAGRLDPESTAASRRDVRYLGSSGEHMLYGSFSVLDPKQTVSPIAQKRKGARTGHR